MNKEKQFDKNNQVSEQYYAHIWRGLYQSEKKVRRNLIQSIEYCVQLQRCLGMMMLI
ncbi:unnamed protein product [Paramecium sonneborni]|uniref:Uncharacterized protein n=1 Tax=Paramecium sonneborni TaxID=65129 RepID=A0A8S1R946_9CILI|nr:unnamed protein product [Paramecium sonneborni]